MRCFILVLYLASVGLVYAQTTTGMRSADRDLQQLQQGFDRYRVEQEIREMRQKVVPDSKDAPKHEANSSEHSFEFFLSGITHDNSTVLTDTEIDQAVSAWVGQKVSAQDLTKIINSINELYHKKGYAVCMAMLKPQRIKGGVLHVTLIEGKTDEVNIVGARYTDPSYILSAFDFKEGEVANYVQMYDDLVSFNMTNDVLLTIDIRPGKKEETTSYQISVREPPNWAGTVFADTLGTDSTGRPRLGASITNRSVLGRRDAATLLGVVSQGSYSVFGTYSLPLTSHGTKLSAGLSYGEVEIVKGPSRSLDVDGNSLLWTVRLDHPFWVSSDTKWTAYAEYAKKESETNVFGAIRMSDTDTQTVSLGLETLYVSESWLFYINNTLALADTKDNLFNDNDRRYRIFKGNLLTRYDFTNEIHLSLTGAWQAKLSGDDLMTADYFYLGHVSGVRGYDNDVLSAENGFYVNAQLGWNFLGPKTELYAFLDYGRLSGFNPYEVNYLSSTGLGIRWPIFDGASLELTGSVPLHKDIGEAGHVSGARADISAVIHW